MKSLKYYFVGSLICLIFLLIGGVFVGYSNSFVFAEETVASTAPTGNGTETNPYKIASEENLKYVSENIANENYATGYFVLTSSIEIDFCQPIGTAENSFRGVFDGNGKTISVKHTEILENTKLGLFGYINGATIKNLGVDYDLRLNGEDLINEKIVVGGIAANAVASTISECYCNFSLKSTKVETLNQSDIKSFYTEQRAIVEGFENNKFSIGGIEYEIVGNKVEYVVNGTNETKDIIENKFIIDGIEYTIVENGIEFSKFETYKYNGEILAGGLVGEGSSVKVLNSYCFPEITINQNSSYENVYGGIVGAINNGEVRNVYVAPTEKLATAIANKNGVLSAVESKDCQFILFSNEAKSTFGGIVGFGSGGNLVVSNTFFGGIVSSNENLIAGGIVGKIPENSTFWPKSIEFGKYVGFINPGLNVVGLSNAIGNYAEVGGYNVATSVSAVSALPTLVDFSSWTWEEFNPWDFENVWKTTSTVTQTTGFFPMLQKFSSFKIQVSTNKAVSFDKNNKYLSGYLTFKINNEETSVVEVSSGSNVTITATFYSDNKNDHHVFKNYFMITNWIFGEKPIQGGLDYDVEFDETKGQAKLTFTATSKTEGIYDVAIKGKPVKVDVSLKNFDEQGQKENIGSVSITQANQPVKKNENFSFEIAEYLSGELVTLNAFGTESGDFVFGKWEDGTNNFETSKTEIVVELDNEKKSSSSRFYPEVVFDGEKLVANLNAYFLNNTSTVEFKIEGAGEIIANEISFGTGDSENFVNSKTISLSAIPIEEYEFEGWFVGDEKISEETTYSFLVLENVEITAKFKAIEKKGGLVMPIWLIIVIVAVPLVLGGVITIVVVKVKNKNKSGYRKHYKF